MADDVAHTRRHGGRWRCAAAGSAERPDRHREAPPDGLRPGALRGLSRFNNFAISFTIISILSGCLTLYYFGLQHGGPPTMLWGWLLVGVLVIFVACRWPRSVRRSRPPAASTTGPRSSRPATAPPSGPGSPAGSTCSARSLSRPASASAAPFRFRPSSPCTEPELLAVTRTYDRHPGRHPLCAGPAEHVQHPSRRPAERHLGVVAHHRRARHSHHLPGAKVARHQSASFLFGSAGWHAFAGLSGSRYRSTSSSSAC